MNCRRTSLSVIAILSLVLMSALPALAAVPGWAVGVQNAGARLVATDEDPVLITRYGKLAGVFYKVSPKDTVPKVRSALG